MSSQEIEFKNKTDPFLFRKYYDIQQNKPLYNSWSCSTKEEVAWLGTLLKVLKEAWAMILRDAAQGIKHWMRNLTR